MLHINEMISYNEVLALTYPQTCELFEKLKKKYDVSDLFRLCRSTSYSPPIGVFFVLVRMVYVFRKDEYC